ncbi:hypothetical protein [Pandoraea sp. NPDC090278]|uniref:hypothetical protein n=1 Tax=Pandoraea sp. NPDC090278 TaxID=3364391 RepID=UPI00383BA309
MWTTKQPLPYRTRLIIGCGANHSHLGQHLQADTLNVSVEDAPDLLGDICADRPNPELMGRYRVLLCECLPFSVYGNGMLYQNLEFLRAPNSCIVFLSVPGPGMHALEKWGWAYDWQLQDVMTVADLPPQLGIDPDFAHHLQFVLKTSPFPSLLVR